MKKRFNALHFLIGGIIVLILVVGLIVTSGVLATWLDPEPEALSIQLLR